MHSLYSEIEWDDYNSGKNLVKHNVTDDEIGQVFENPYVIFRHKKYQDRKIILGETNGGRYLFMSVQHKSETCCRPIHARDMEPYEKKQYLKIIGHRRI